MATTLFTEQDNGNLKLVAEVEGIESPALAVDALLDENPRFQGREFVVISGSLDEGNVVRVIVESDEPVNPRRAIRVSSNGSSAVAEVEQPVRRKPGRPRKAQAAKPATPRKAAAPRKAATGKVDGRTKAGRALKAKAGTATPPKPRKAPKAAAAKKPAAPRKTSGGSPFKRNAKSDD